MGKMRNNENIKITNKIWISSCRIYVCIKHIVLHTLKSPGTSDRSPEMMSQYSFEEVSVLRKWKEANFVRIYRKGDRENRLNYRPLPLTEQCLLTARRDYFEANGYTCTGGNW